MGLQRCGQVVYWLRDVLGIEQIDKDALSRRTSEYVAWVEAMARKQKLDLEWAEKGVKKARRGNRWVTGGLIDGTE